MRAFLLITTAAFLAGNVAAIAEDKGKLPKAGYIGAVTGNEEKDTFAYNGTASSTCDAGSQCPDAITTGAVQAATAGEATARYHGSHTGDAEKDTFAY